MIPQTSSIYIKPTLTVTFSEKESTLTRTHYALRPSWSEPEERIRLLEEKEQRVQEERRQHGF